MLHQMVELAAVGQKAALEVIDLAKHGLYIADMGTDRHLAAQVVANMLGRREMVRMRMGFQYPLQLPASAAHIVDQCIR